MRGGLSFAFVLALGATASASPSNPAFLGISFQPGPNNVGVEIGSVTAGSPAARAGMRPGDRVLAIDGHGVSVNELNSFIVAHEPGDTIKLQVLRGLDEYLELTPTLTTRADMFDRLLGNTLPELPINDSETHHIVELGKPSGHATVVAWYHANGAGAACIDPIPVVQHVASRVSSIKDSGATVVGATYFGHSDGEEVLAQDRKRLGLPVLVTTQADFGSVAVDECARVFVMVLDCHGVVTFLTPITDGDDEDATLDEIATAAAQADHKRR